MSYVPIKKLTKEEVQERAREYDGGDARLALVEAHYYGEEVNFYEQNGMIQVVPKKK